MCRRLGKLARRAARRRHEKLLLNQSFSMIAALLRLLGLV
jgi:hypothetical protein